MSSGDFVFGAGFGMIMVIIAGIAYDDIIEAPKRAKAVTSVAVAPETVKQLDPFYECQGIQYKCQYGILMKVTAYSEAKVLEEVEKVLSAAKTKGLYQNSFNYYVGRTGAISTAQVFVRRPHQEPLTQMELELLRKNLNPDLGTGTVDWSLPSKGD